MSINSFDMPHTPTDDLLMGYGVRLYRKSDKDVWSWAFHGVSGGKPHTERVGKWMLWPEGINAIEAWKTIVELTRSNRLGTQAKISAQYGRELVGERLICVYTYDSDDMEDLQRIVNVLREHIDPAYRLVYKEDRATRAGYYQGSGKVTSKWYVKPFETLIRPVKGYEPPE